jgi:hypothetical protein
MQNESGTQANTLNIITGMKGEIQHGGEKEHEN